MHLALWVRYDGTAYHGFQAQPNVRTVQQVMEQAIFRLTGETVRIYGAGRTDAGVHARKQVVHCSVNARVPIERWCVALNAHLPNDVVVWNAFEVSQSFHARKSAVYKTYVYTLLNAPFPDPVHAHTQWHIVRPLDECAMNEAAGRIVGVHDFSSFCAARSSARSHVRQVVRAAVHATVPLDGIGRTILCTFTGNGFLYNMVRIIVGTLVHIGCGLRGAEDITAIIDARDRAHAGPTAPPHGLTLWDVAYDART
jgi:tRNA pseudouridine38-40 synthase